MYDAHVNVNGRRTMYSNQQFVYTLMAKKLKTEWDTECVRYICLPLYCAWSINDHWLSYTIFLIRWLAKPSRPLFLCENYKAYRTFIKNKTYGHYQPPYENAAYSELLNLVAETESIITNVIRRYQHEGLVVSMSTHIWSENSKSFLREFYCDGII